MNRIAVIAVLVVAMPACAPGPCPEGQARDNGGKCVALAPPAAQANVFDQFDPPAPTKDEYLAGQEAAAAFNREQLAKSEAARARFDAEWAADRRADRAVEAQRETQAAVERIEDKL